ncbi:MAG: hypothetical protein U9N52_00725 [Campylobacterota bacterium]|nr:hypothetical protein [Campylobacterota bacterium]
MAEALLSDIVLVDIIGFSKLNVSSQQEIISYISKSYKKMITRMLQNSNMLLEQLLSGIVPTGDGFFCILNPIYRGYGAILALSFNHLSELISKKFSYFRGIRIAVHTGKVHRFIDILDHENFVGHGMNECERYISSQSHRISTVIMSRKAYESLEQFLLTHQDFHSLLMEREFKFSPPFYFEDKHKNRHQAYTIWMRQGGIINPPHITLQRSKYAV